MSVSSVHILYTRDQIASRVASLAREISGDYEGGDLLVVGILKGAFIFLADLIRQMTVPVQVDFVRLASYGGSTESHGILSFTKDLEMSVEDRDLLVVEDIVDTGRTLKHLLDDLRSRGPRSVKSCVLLDKRHRREVPLGIDYVGFLMADGFVVGYGLDCAEAFRYLPDVCILETDERSAVDSVEPDQRGPAEREGT